MTALKSTSNDQKIQTLRQLFEAYKLKDRQIVEQLLTDTFTYSQFFARFNCNLYRNQSIHTVNQTATTQIRK